MLINYIFSNFRSFKNKTILSMEAGRQRTLNENLIKEKGKRILPSMVIYGANASGKSNIIMSLAIMRDIILAGSLESQLPNLITLELYPFAHNGEKRPIIFEIEFINKGYHLIYGFEVSCELFEKSSREILSEQLFVIIEKNKQIKLFGRNREKVSLMKDKKALEIMNFKASLLEEFEKKINSNLDKSDLFLSNAFKSTISNEIAEVVLDFFKNKLFVVSDFTLKKANLTFSFKEMPEKDFLIWNNIVDGFVRNADFGPQKIAFKPMAKDNKDSTNVELVSIYEKNDKILVIPAELMESRGTLKLIDFAIPFEMLFKSGGVFVIDEFDAAIHPEIIKGIIELFNDQNINTNGAQLIFTTHNPIYLNNKIFRRDQIQFVEKDKDTYESIIYSLADFGSVDVRNDHNYLLNYFKGRYGALPFIDFSRLLRTNNSKEES